MSNLKVKKKAYLKLIEVLVANGYDISYMLHPIWKNISAENCINSINKLMQEHDENVWDYEEKVTLNNI